MLTPSTFWVMINCFNFVLPAIKGHISEGPTDSYLNSWLLVSFSSGTKVRAAFLLFLNTVRGVGVKFDLVETRVNFCCCCQLQNELFHFFLLVRTNQNQKHSVFWQIVVLFLGFYLLLCLMLFEIYVDIFILTHCFSVWKLLSHFWQLWREMCVRQSVIAVPLCECSSCTFLGGTFEHRCLRDSSHCFCRWKF